MADLLFVGQFIASKTGKTGLTVTVDVDRYTLADGSRTALITAGAATEGRRGLYHYRLVEADLATYQYVATFVTTDTSVDQQEITALGLVVPDALVSSRLAPTDAGRTLDILATGEASANVTLWKGDAVAGAPALETTAQAILEDTGTTLPGLLTSTLASFVNTYSTDATTAGSITRRRGDSWAIVPAALGVLTGYTSLWLTIKRSHDDADSASVLHVKKNASGLLDGLLYLNGAASTSNLASITVTDALTGVISIAVDEAATKELAPGEYYYDVQALIGGNVSTPDSGTFTVTADVTRSVV